MAGDSDEGTVYNGGRVSTFFFPRCRRPMPLCRPLSLLPAAVILMAIGGIRTLPAEAGVAVLGNRTGDPIEFAVQWPSGATTRHRLEAWSSVPVPVTSPVKIVVDANGTAEEKTLRPGLIYYFVLQNERLELGRVAIPSSEAAVDPPPPPKPGATIAPMYTVPVMLLADEDEPAVARLWQKRLRDRLAAASKVFELYCRVRFEVVAVGRWNSDNRITDFNQSLREFELEVNPAPARLAIGFTSQYRRPAMRRMHLGGTRGALHSHILIREWAQHVTRVELLEVLVHELGHYLGATHSPEGNSVMRPKLGDGRAHARSFRIGFDPLNTFIIYTLGEELRAGRYRGLSRLHPHTKAQLRDIYLAVAKMMPEDESTKHYLKYLDPSPRVRARPTLYPKPLVEATQIVVQAVTDAARRNNATPTGPGGSAVAGRVSGDRLTELYVRRAAAAAAKLPRDVAAKAFLLGLGISLDNTTTLRYAPMAGQFCRQVESSQQRRERLAVLGSPTMRGRRDLAKHFAVSGALTALIGPQAAEATGIAKEIADARGSSGFSFVDVAADLAGTTFASHVRDGKIPLEALVVSFAVGNFLPELHGLQEGISWDDFLRQYQSTQGDGFRRQQTAIRQRILALPGYKTMPSRSS